MKTIDFTQEQVTKILEKIANEKEGLVDSTTKCKFFTKIIIKGFRW